MRKEDKDVIVPGVMYASPRCVIFVLSVVGTTVTYHLDNTYTGTVHNPKCGICKIRLGELKGWVSMSTVRRIA